MLDYLAVQSGPVLNPASGPTVLGIPDDFAWVNVAGKLKMKVVSFEAKK